MEWTNSRTSRERSNSDHSGLYGRQENSATCPNHSQCLRPNLVYDQSPIDLLLGRNCPDFRQIIYEAEGFRQTFAVTRQQTHQEEAEDIQLESMNDNFDLISNPELTPFNMIIRKDYDYQQSNLSFLKNDQLLLRQTKCHTLWTQQIQIAS